MKKVLYSAILLLISISAKAQFGKTTLVTDEAVIRDSFQLGGSWVTEVSSSGDWTGPTHEQLATRKAIKDYVNALVVGASDGCTVYQVADTSEVVAPLECDIAYIGADTIYIRDSLLWLPFFGGGGGADSSIYATRYRVDSLRSVQVDTNVVFRGELDGLADSVLALRNGLIDLEGYVDSLHNAQQATLNTQADSLTAHRADLQAQLDSLTNLRNDLTALQAQADTLPTQGYVDSLHQVIIDSLTAQRDDIDAQLDSLAQHRLELNALANQADTLLTGQGTIDTLPIFTAARRLGNSSLFQSASRLSLGGNRALRLIGGTDAQRPAGSAGDLYWNTTSAGLNLHDGADWRWAARQDAAAPAANRIPFYTANGVISSASNFSFQSSSSNPLLSISGVSASSGNFIALSNTPSDTRIGIGMNNVQYGVIANSIARITSSTRVETQNAFTSQGGFNGLFFNTPNVGASIQGAGGSSAVVQMRFGGTQAITNTEAITYQAQHVGISIGNHPNDCVGLSIGGAHGTIFSESHTGRMIGFLVSPHLSLSTLSSRRIIADFGQNSDVDGVGRIETHNSVMRIMRGGQVVIGADVYPNRQLDIRGGLRILPDSLQNTTTRLAGLNAQGDVTSLIPKGLSIATGAGSAPDTLSVSPSARAHLHYSTADTIVAGSYRILKNAASSLLQDFTATDSTLTYTGTGGVFKIDIRVNIEIRSSETGAFYVEQAAYLNSSQIAAMKTTNYTHMQSDPVAFVVSSSSALVELQENDVIDLRVNPTSKANTAFLVEGATLIITEQ